MLALLAANLLSALPVSAQNEPSLFFLLGGDDPNIYGAEVLDLTQVLQNILKWVFKHINMINNIPTLVG